MIKNLLRILVTSAALLFILLVIQTFSHTYKSQVYIVWIWYFALYIPLLSILFIANKKSESSEKNLLLSALTSLFSIGSLVVPFTTLQNNVISIQPYFYSLIYLLPLEILILFLYKKSLLNKGNPADKERNTEPLVFISYNHGDKDIAYKVNDSLSKLGIRTIIDKESMFVGDKIKNFIENSIQESNTIVSLVSNKSLQSAWVAFETISTLNLVDNKNKRFIACLIERDFFKSDYTASTVEEIETKLAHINDLIEQANDKMLDTQDLNAEKTRMINLRNNLNSIVRHIRESLTLCMDESEYENSIQQLIKVLQHQEDPKI